MDIYFLLLFVGPAVTTVPVAVFLCRRGLARNRPLSYGTMMTAASCIPVLLAIVATCIDPNMWWTREGKNVPELWFLLLAFMTGICVLPALCVVVFYQRRQKKYAPPTV